MWELFREVITSPFGSFASVLALALLAFYAAWKMGGLIEKFKSIEKLDKSIDSIKNDISTIKAYIQLTSEHNNPFAERSSPISLNKKGREVSGELNTPEIIRRSWEKISKDIKKKISTKNDLNPYTIQEVCFEMGKRYSEYFDELSMDRIKTYAFNQGYNLTYFEILFGIEIRDKYFKENNLKTEEIDKHDPAKSS